MGDAPQNPPVFQASLHFLVKSEKYKSNHVEYMM